MSQQAAKYFGVPVELLMRRPDHASEKIPYLVRMACNSLYKNALKYGNGIEFEGIFRESGNHDRVNYLKELFDKNEIAKHCAGNSTDNPFDIEDPHVTSSVLKLFLREFPDPIMRYENTDAVLSTAKFVKNPSGSEEETLPLLKVLKEIIRGLTPERRRLLRVVLHLSKETAARSAKNKMRPSNLGIVFGQVFFREEPSAEPVNVMVAMQSASFLNKAAEFMIERYDALFSETNAEDAALLTATFPSLVPALPYPFNEEEPDAQTVLNALYENEKGELVNYAIIEQKKQLDLLQKQQALLQGQLSVDSVLEKVAQRRKNRQSTRPEGLGKTIITSKEVEFLDESPAPAPASTSAPAPKEDEDESDDDDDDDDFDFSETKEEHTSTSTTTQAATAQEEEEYAPEVDIYQINETMQELNDIIQETQAKDQKLHERLQGIYSVLYHAVYDTGKFKQTGELMTYAMSVSIDRSKEKQARASAQEAAALHKMIHQQKRDFEEKQKKMKAEIQKFSTVMNKYLQ